MFDLPIVPEILLRGTLLTAVVVLWILGIVRIIGLRSFSKMTAFDFVATIASGSLLANAATASEWAQFAQAMVAVAALFLVQVALAALRKASPRARKALGNTPILLMRDGRFLDEALAETRVSRADVLEKLRGQNIHRFDAVRAVVLETTGDITILHGGDPDADLLRGVRGVEAGPIRDRPSEP
ncbi:MAG: DUF421 domain-containing protein [Porphyrobacter sp.]|nr:DUF421 domain-containing protein [Porphyrobacter sp.]